MKTKKPIIVKFSKSEANLVQDLVHTSWIMLRNISTAKTRTSELKKIYEKIGQAQNKSIINK